MLQKRKYLIPLKKIISLCVIIYFPFSYFFFSSCSLTFKCELAYGQTHYGLYCNSMKRSHIGKRSRTGAMGTEAPSTRRGLTETSETDLSPLSSGQSFSSGYPTGTCGLFSLSRHIRLEGTSASHLVRPSAQSRMNF